MKDEIRTAGRKASRREEKIKKERGRKVRSRRERRGRRKYERCLILEKI